MIEGEGEFEGLIDKITKNDIVIIISLSGNTTSLESYTNKLSLKGVEFISITKLINNKLSTKTQYNLYATTSEFLLNVFQMLNTAHPNIRFYRSHNHSFDKMRWRSYFPEMPI